MKLNNYDPKSRDAYNRRVFEGARNYAMADRSDPFSFNRAMSHAFNGVSYIRSDGEDSHYEAEPVRVERKLPDGRTFSDGSNTFYGTEYRNIRRP